MNDAHIAYHILATEYFDASALVHQNALTDNYYKINYPAYTLACHSLELYYKSFFLFLGNDIEFLRTTLGHKICKMHELAAENGITEYIELSYDDVSLIQAIDSMVNVQYLRYYNGPGFKRLPDIEAVLTLLGKFKDSLNPRTIRPQ